MDLLTILQTRKSMRKYNGQPVKDEDIKTILQAGLLSASSRKSRPWEFVVVKDRDMLSKLSDCRDHSAKMLEGAFCAIVVLGDTSKSDVWTEDCSIAMSNMHLMADHLGLGSCWIQCRLRQTPDGQSTSEYIKGLLGVPEQFEVQAILSVGAIDKHPEGYTLDSLDMTKIHNEKF
ncbi:MAG: nitroreductase family protein [Firmicutes bacterium]|nr:nitroreductase family protein [Bacillota bacterium]